MSVAAEPRWLEGLWLATKEWKL